VGKLEKKDVDKVFCGRLCIVKCNHVGEKGGGLCSESQTNRARDLLRI